MQKQKTQDLIAPIAVSQPWKVMQGTQVIGYFSNAPCAAHTVIVGRRGSHIAHPLCGNYDKIDCATIFTIPAQIRVAGSYITNPAYNNWLNEQIGKYATSQVKANQA